MDIKTHKCLIFKDQKFDLLLEECSVVYYIQYDVYVKQRSL